MVRNFMQVFIFDTNKKDFVVFLLRGGVFQDFGEKTLGVYNLLLKKKSSEEVSVIICLYSLDILSMSFCVFEVNSWARWSGLDFEGIGLTSERCWRLYLSDGGLLDEVSVWVILEDTQPPQHHWRELPMMTKILPHDLHLSRRRLLGPRPLVFGDSSLTGHQHLDPFLHSWQTWFVLFGCALRKSVSPTFASSRST